MRRGMEVRVVRTGWGETEREEIKCKLPFKNHYLSPTPPHPNRKSGVFFSSLLEREYGGKPARVGTPDPPSPSLHEGEAGRY